MVIEIIKPVEMSDKEANIYIEEEKNKWKDLDKELAKIELSIDGDEVVITATERSPISRVRRITGYLSNMNNFNDAKAAELHNRVNHIK